MSAELLRKAATILRERAEGAITGDGPTRSTSWFAGPMSYSVTSRFEVIAEDEGSILAEGLTEGPAEWFALMDPGVGLALADVLDDVAEKHHKAGREVLVLHPDDPCEVCEDDGHEVDVCGGCYPMWEDVQARAMYPCPEVRRLLPFARLIVGDES